MHEEIGLNLKNQSQYAWIGRVQDQLVFRKRGVMRIIPHVFIDFSEFNSKFLDIDKKSSELQSQQHEINTFHFHENEKQSEFKLQHDEVAHAWWVDFDSLVDTNNCRWKTWNIRNYVFETRTNIGIGKNNSNLAMRASNLKSYLVASVVDIFCRILQVTTVQFPSIFVGHSVITAAVNAEALHINHYESFPNADNITISNTGPNKGGSESHDAPAAVSVSHDPSFVLKDADFELWGLTLTAVNNVLRQSLQVKHTSEYNSSTLSQVEHKHNYELYVTAVNNSLLLRQVRVDNRLFTTHLHAWFAIRLKLLEWSKQKIRPPFSWVVPMAVLSYGGSLVAIGTVCTMGMLKIFQ